MTWEGHETILLNDIKCIDNVRSAKYIEDEDLWWVRTKYATIEYDHKTGWVAITQPADTIKRADVTYDKFFDLVCAFC